MGNKAMDKDYLLRQFKNFDNNILEEKYLTKSEGGGSASSEAIAPIEESSTVSHLYPVGSLLFYNNTLYKTKTALTIGDTIITKGANANVEATDIDTELKNKQNDLGLLVKNGKLCVRYAVEE